MSEIDWDKAPEGFTLWLEFKTAEHRVHSGWYRKDGNYFKGYYGAHWPEYRTGQFFNVHYKSDKHLINDAYLAPIRPSQSWSGEGLPPVGTVCQWFSPIYGWLGGKVVGHDGTLTVIAHNDGYTGCHPHEVRPIRTPEQIATDEREAAVAAMLELDPYLPNTTLGMMSRADFCRTLYDAGYRKP